MSTHAEIFNKLKELSKSSASCLVATFVSYQKDTHTITVELPNGLKIPGVRLKAAANKNTGYYMIMIPRAKSTVLITQVGASAEAGEYYLLSTDEWETLELVRDQSKVVIDKTGILLSQDKSEFKIKTDGKLYFNNDGHNLYSLINNMIQMIKGINIQITGTAGSYPLVVTAAVVNQTSKQSFDNLWENFQEILAVNKV